MLENDPLEWPELIQQTDQIAASRDLSLFILAAWRGRLEDERFALHTSSRPPTSISTCVLGSGTEKGI